MISTTCMHAHVYPTFFVYTCLATLHGFTHAKASNAILVYIPFFISLK